MSTTNVFLNQIIWTKGNDTLFPFAMSKGFNEVLTFQNGYPVFIFLVL